MEPVCFWIAFNTFILIMLLLDLFVFHKEAHEVSFKEALGWSLFWISLALIFNVIVYYWKGSEAALQFLTGYLVEESLSIDNLFVISMIFTYFHTPHKYLHKVLFWGILGAIVMRAGFILFGITLIQSFHWILYIFGVFLVYTGIKLVTEHNKKIEPEKNPVLRLFRKFFPITENYEEGHFFVKRAGKYFATPLCVVLVSIETTDLIFAVDSIPAILAITNDPFIVYTSNIFAILGLRSLFFALSGMIKLFDYLHYGLGAILVFIGLKMVLSDVVKIPIHVALGFVVLTLVGSVIVSLVMAGRKKENI